MHNLGWEPWLWISGSQSVVPGPTALASPGNLLEMKILSVQFSCSVMSNSLRPHELQHARLPCPSPTPRVHPNSRPLSQRCHPTISSSVVPFSFCLQSFPTAGSFPMSQLFTWSGQSTGVSASASVLPMNTQDWSPLGCTGWISLQSKGLSRVFSNTTVQKHQFFGNAIFSLLFLGNFLIILVCWEFLSWKVIEFCQMPLQYPLRWHKNKQHQEGKFYNSTEGKFWGHKERTDVKLQKGSGTWIVS